MYLAEERMAVIPDCLNDFYIRELITSLEQIQCASFSFDAETWQVKRHFVAVGVHHSHSFRSFVISVLFLAVVVCHIHSFRSLVIST